MADHHGFKTEFMKITAAIMLPSVGGAITNHIMYKNLKNWYTNLILPARPPSWVFSSMRIALYSGMGYASYLVCRDGGGLCGKAARLPLLAYATQLALYWAWTPIFFVCHSMTGSLIDILALTVIASACGILFFRVNKTAGYMFIPYVAWLGFTSRLNYNIYKLNTNTNDITEKQN